MKEVIRDFWRNIASKCSFWLPIIIFATIAYSFSLTNRTVGIDDLAGDYYLSNMSAIKGTRWGMLIWDGVFHVGAFSPFIDKILAFIFFVCAALIISCVFFILNGQKGSVWKYSMFVSVFITFPLINEIWEYYGANLMVAGNLFLAATCILLLSTSSIKLIKKILYASCALVIVVSSYESIAFVYVLLVFCILFYKYYHLKKEEFKFLEYFKEGIFFASPLVIALFLRIIIGMILLKTYNVEFSQFGETAISWDGGIWHLISTIVNQYVLNGLVYFPIAIFDIMVLFFVFFLIISMVYKQKIFIFFSGTLILVSVFMQAILQGKAMPYRTAQTLTVFVAFCVFLLIELGEHVKKRYMWSFVTLVSIVLCMHQSIYLGQLFSLNNQRSENEAAVIRQIGQQLTTRFEDKTIIFVGKYDLGNWISSKISVDDTSWNGKLYLQVYDCFIASFKEGAKTPEYVQTNVNSVLNWAIDAFEGQMMLKELFSYYGYDIKVIESFDGEYEAACQVAKEKDMDAFEIADMEDYVIVCLGTL